jgi:hypothetical protein
MVLGAAATQSVVANSIDSPCMDGEASAPDLPAGLVVLHGGVASTHQPSASGSSALKEGDLVTATVNVAGVDIPALGLSIAGIRAEASTTCKDGQPVLAGTSTVGEVRVAGTPVRLLEGPLAVPLGVATLHLNETIHDGGRIIQRAVWLQSPQGDVIIGEATTGATGPVCGSAMITIASHTTSFGQPFSFTGDLGTFVLPEQGTPTPSDRHAVTVAPGRYSVTQSLSPGQAALSPLQDVTCSPNSAVTIDLSSGTVRVVVKPGDSVTCTFTNGTARLGAGGPPPSTVHPPPGTVHVKPSFNPIVLSPTPRIDVTPSSQPSPTPSPLFGKALPVTSGENAAGGISAIWLLLVVGILALLFLFFVLWRRRKEQEHDPSP